MSKVRICYQTVAAPGITEKKVDEILAFSKSHEILSIKPVFETIKIAEIAEILRYVDEEFTGENLFLDYRESAKQIAKGMNLKPQQDVVCSDLTDDVAMNMLSHCPYEKSELCKTELICRFKLISSEDNNNSCGLILNHQK
jgi:hypothetical protein